MFDARFSMRCPEWIHKIYAPSRFEEFVQRITTGIDRAFG